MDLAEQIGETAAIYFHDFESEKEADEELNGENASDQSDSAATTARTMHLHEADVTLNSFREHQLVILLLLNW